MNREMVASAFARPITRRAVNRALVASALPLLAPLPTLAKPEHEAAGPSTMLLVRPDGQGGPLLGVDTTSGATTFALPPGLLAADHATYFASVVEDGATALDVYDPWTGILRWRTYYDGDWALRGVSPTGKWLGFVRTPSDEETTTFRATDDWRTEVLVIDVATGGVAHELHLAGNFDIDTISARGDALFLVQHLPADNPEHYLIRLYDLTEAVLVEGALRDKLSTDEFMTGYAWDGVGSPEGRWLLTLYLNTARDNAFVHTLDLESRYPSCITLPSGDGDLAKLKSYTLTLAGWRAFATNPVLGKVAEIELASRTIRRVASFPAVTPAPTGDRPAGRAVLSPDGRRLYFSAGQVVWAYDTSAGQIVNSYLAPPRVAALGVGDDGRRLFVAEPDGRLTAIDTASGSVSAVTAD